MSARWPTIVVIFALWPLRLLTRRLLGRAGEEAPVVATQQARRTQPSVSTTVFGSVNASSTELPPTRPTPELEPARPPNGRWLSQ